MLNKNEISIRDIKYLVLDKTEINKLNKILPKEEGEILEVRYYDNSRFVVSYVPASAAMGYLCEMVEEQEKAEEIVRRDAIVKSLTRSVSKLLTNTVSDDVYVSIVDTGTGEVYYDLTSYFFRRVYDKVTRIDVDTGFVSVTADDVVYRLYRV